METIARYLCETRTILRNLNEQHIDYAIKLLCERYPLGRVYVIGVGGSAANASHFVADLRALCGMDAYCATDNVATLTAQTNDFGWDTFFEAWLKQSRIGAYDVVVVLSVGGGSPTLSAGISRAVQYAHDIAGALVIGIVGRDGGATKQFADACIVIPPMFPDHVTPHTEEVQSVLLHLIVTALAYQPPTWERHQHV